MQADGPYISICPTFNPRSNGNPAANVVHPQSPSPNSKPQSDSDFAFATPNSVPPSPIPADRIFQNGRIRPLYPTDKDADSYFDSHSHLHSNDEIGNQNSVSARRNPLKRLFEEKKLTRTAATLSSSSENHIPDESPKQLHCPYPPPAAAEEEARSRWSIFGGNNPRSWRIVGLLNRIHVRHHGKGGASPS